MQRAHSLKKTLILGKIEGKRRKGWQRKKWLDSVIDSVDMNLSKLQEIVEDRGAWRAAVGLQSTFCSLNVSDDLNGLLRGLSAKESACSAGDTGSVPGSGRSLSKEMFEKPLEKVGQAVTSHPSYILVLVG